MKFETAQGKVINNAVLYIKEHIAKWPEDVFNIYVGSDSQDTNRQTVYATAIVIHRVGKGAHVIFRKEKVDKIKDDYERLWGEPERSIEVAAILRKDVCSKCKQPSESIVISGEKRSECHSSPMEMGIENLVKTKGWQDDGIVIDLDFNENPRWLSNKLLKAAKGWIVGMGFKVRAKPASWRSVYMADRLARDKA